MLSRVALFILYQSAWFMCIHTAAAGRPLLSLTSITLAGVIALRVAPKSTRLKAMYWALIGGVVGLIIDSAFCLMNLYAFPPQTWLTQTLLHPLLGHMSTLWMAGLWFTFFAFLRGHVYTLLQRPLRLAILGGVGGPLSYAYGARAGAMTLEVSTEVFFGTMGALWASVMLSSAWIYLKFEHGEHEI